jgi:hypothetical protein
MATLDEALREFRAQYDTSRRYFTTDVLAEEFSTRGHAQTGLFILKSVSSMAKGYTLSIEGTRELVAEINNGCPALIALNAEYGLKGIGGVPVIDQAIAILTEHKEAALTKLRGMHRGYDVG